ncbi:MAG: bifunctional folylpolyglutamate synthase/dihydrofolate synthase [Gemmatimonadaceae bacterium]|nr:bifunctional folylpolyglutamate synthase/dihydrofolate synthase [Gemmatimonadaceae bacterium]
MRTDTRGASGSRVTADPATDARYRAALESLFQRTGGVWRLGLDHVRDFLARLGEPHLAVPTFHVAGTNGKGSTVATLDAMLRHAGLRVGRYMSPHLVDFTERIVVDGRAIAPEVVTGFLDAQADAADATGATFFEVTTALAFTYFRDQHVDVAVIETGMGGRLDATNVVEPLAAGVTSIGFDHMAYLGDTLEAIAGEKAGIYKPGAPAIVGESDVHIGDLLEARARAAGASTVLRAGRDWQVRDVEFTTEGTRFVRRTARGERTLVTPLVGLVQAGNASVALAMLEGAGGAWAQLAESAPQALSGVRLAGRFQRVPPWVFDVAHNPDGIDVLLETVRRSAVPSPVVALVSVLKDKDWRAMLDRLGPAVSRLILTAAPTAPPSRAWDLGEVADYVRARGWAHAIVPDFAEALSSARAAGRTVLVTGSFHTVGDAMDRLQVDPLAA